MTKHIILFVVFSICISSPSLFSQSLEGLVVDEDTQLPLPYVHIGIPGKNMGTISQEDGTFKINLEKAMKEYQLVFSMIGYVDKKIPVALLKDKTLRISMQRTVYDLTQVEIKNSRLYKKSNKRKKIGGKRFTQNLSGGSGLGFGGEMGIKIKSNGNLYKATQINFKTTEVTFDSLLFRINFYTIKNGLPDSTLLSRPIYINALYNETWISKDIQTEEIFFEEDIIVTIEVIKGWSTTKRNHGVFFNKRILYPSKTYLRDSSQDKWRIWKYPRLTLNLEVEKYQRKSQNQD